MSTNAMKMNNVYITFFCVLLTLSSCTSSLNKKDYVSWIQDSENGLKREKTVAHLNFSLQYRTYLYDCIIRNKSIEKIDKEDPLELYTLKLEVDKNGVDIVDYLTHQKGLVKPQVLEYLSSHLEKDIQLVVGEESKPPLFCQFERSFDLKGHRLFVLAFKLDKEEKKKDRVLVIDSPLLSVGKIKLRIRQSDIMNIPELKL